VFFFDRNGWPIVRGHKTAGNWRRRFQSCDEERICAREVLLELVGCCNSGDSGGRAMDRN
jgi:hypothetical protein